MSALLLSLLACLVAGPQTGADSGSAVRAAIGQLGSFDFSVRTNAGRVIRRGPAGVTGPLLADAVLHAKDEYVRFRAFVLLTGIDDTSADLIARTVMTDRDDRLRTTAYQWFEHRPRPGVLPRLVAALKTEDSEFVRPALTRALAASASDPAVRQALVPLVLRGEDIFRGSLIVALGDYGGRYALSEIASVAKLDGPLRDDAVTALGRLGDASSLPLLVDLQQHGAREVQPTVSAALCLLGIDCDARLAYLSSTLAFAAREPGYQPLLRGAVHGLAVLATGGRDEALSVLFDAGTQAGESARAPIALGVGLVALRDADVVLRVLDRRSDRAAVLDLLRDAFDMLSEDFEEERFATAVRLAFAAAPADSTRHAVAGAVLTELEY